MILLKLGIMVLNVMIRHFPSMTFKKVGRSFYTSQGSQAIFGGVEVWQGYFQSVRITQGRITINVDSSGSAFYEIGSLIQMVMKLLGRHGSDGEFKKEIM